MTTKTIRQPVLTSKALQELEALKGQPIDLTDPDAPEVTDWSQAELGKFKFTKHYTLQEQTLSKAFDADVIEWITHQDNNTQKSINEMLRQMMSIIKMAW